MSKEGQLIFEFLGNSAYHIKKKYKLNPIGSGVSMPGGSLRELDLIFETNSHMPKEQLRKILLASASELVQSVNSNSEILKILHEPPFTHKNVEITIFNHDKSGSQIYDPEIGVAEIINGKLIYATNDRFSYVGYKNKTEETYEEALKAINQTKND